VKTVVVAFAVVWNFPLLSSQASLKLKKISLFCGGMIAVLAAKRKLHNQRKRRQNLKNVDRRSFDKKGKLPVFPKITGENRE
jgi:hypothetical protein